MVLTLAGCGTKEETTGTEGETHAEKIDICCDIFNLSLISNF